MCGRALVVLRIEFSAVAVSQDTHIPHHMFHMGVENMPGIARCWKQHLDSKDDHMLPAKNVGARARQKHHRGA